MRRRIAIAALLVLAVVAVDVPLTVAAEPKVSTAAEVEAAAPAPTSGPRDLAKELGGGSAGVDVDVKLPGFRRHGVVTDQAARLAA